MTKPLSYIAAGLAACIALVGLDVFVAASIAQEATSALPPGITVTPVGEPLIPAPAFVPADWVWAWNYIATASFIGWAMGHFRAWVPFLGRLGWLTTLGDLLAGNYWHAKNES